MDEKRHEEDEVKVSDHRRFDSEGNPKDQNGEVKESAEGTGTPQSASEPAEKAPPKEEAGGLPPIDFTTFVLSLATSAQVHLGIFANPSTGKEEKNLPLARETIDLLSILREKTKGNLTPDEERLFEHVLYDLRMMFVEKSKQK